MSALARVVRRRAFGVAVALAGGGAAAGVIAEVESVPSPVSPGLAGHVVRVVDGDTLLVRLGAAEERVRLLGADAPESVRPGSPVMCGSRRAAARMRSLAPVGASIRLRTDPATGDDRDRYRRVLAIATIGRRDPALTLIQEGWARVYAYRDRDFHGRDRYEAAERDAAEAGRGVFGACGGDFDKPQRRAATP